MNKHTQPQRVRYAIAAAVLLMGAGCASPQSGASILPASSAVLPSTPFNSKAAPFHRALGNDVFVYRHIQFANGTGQTIYPQLTQPEGWASDHPPKPIPPGGKDLPIILGSYANGVIPDYEVMYGTGDPPTSGAIFKAHFNPGAADPFTYELDSGGGLQMTQKDLITGGGTHITVFTVVTSPSSS